MCFEQGLSQDLYMGSILSFLLDMWNWNFVTIFHVVSCMEIAIFKYCILTILLESDFYYLKHAIKIKWARSLTEGQTLMCSITFYHFSIVYNMWLLCVGFISRMSIYCYMLLLICSLSFALYIAYGLHVCTCTTLFTRYTNMYLCYLPFIKLVHWNWFIVFVGLFFLSYAVLRH